jgi:hypothetical protein
MKFKTSRELIDMKKYFFVAGLMVLLIPGFVLGKQTDPSSDSAEQENAIDATPSPTPSATPLSQTFSPDHLKGRWAVGVSSVSGTTLALRYWCAEDEALDLLVGGSDSPLSGTDPNNNYISTPNWSYGLSLGLRHNLEKPAENVYVQWLERITYYQTFSQSDYSGDLSTNQSQDLTFFTGPGFEAFVPFWKNLSIEGNIGLAVDSHWVQSAQSGTSTFPSSGSSTTSHWTLSFGWNNTITSILNAAVHIYF